MSSSSASSSSASSSNAAGESTAATAASAGAVGPNVASVCPPEKWHYEKCFQNWYNHEYLTGRSQDLGGCSELLEKYRTCVITHYEKNEPDFLVQAGSVSDDLLKSVGHKPFETKYRVGDQAKK